MVKYCWYRCLVRTGMIHMQNTFSWMTDVDDIREAPSTHVPVPVPG